MRQFTKSKLDIWAISRKSSSPKQDADLLSFVGKIAGPKSRDPSFGLNVWGFAAISFLLVASLATVSYLAPARLAKKEILGSATAAYQELDQASQSLSSYNFSAASDFFNKALTSLELARGQFAPFKFLTAFDSQANSADHLLSGAYQLSVAGEKLSDGLKLFDSLKVNSTGVLQKDFNQSLAKSHDSLNQSLAALAAASSQFAAADSVPPEYQSTVAAGKKQIATLRPLLKNLADLEDLYLRLFGQDQTYLLIFQNYDEARASGGFIGTYGVLRVANGVIKQLKIDSVYALDSAITDQIASPGPMQPLIKKWGMRDANWFVDFPQSARKLMEFYEKGSQTVDGVIAMTPKLFEDLLSLVGPIPMSQYGVVLNAENFQTLVQYKTSVDYDNSLNQPKKFLADLAPLLLDRLEQLKREQWLSVFEILKSNSAAKQILVYSKYQSDEAKIQSLGLGGEIKASDRDYLAVANSNLGGTKTDLEIEQTFKLRAQILSDGSVLDTLQIQRKNNASEPNKDYVRVLVPAGSILVSAMGASEGAHYPSIADGFKTDPDLALWDQGTLQFGRVFQRMEAGKTEFAFWLNLAPGQTKQVQLTYLLPDKINPTLVSPDYYSLLYQSQDGSKPSGLDAAVDLGTLKPVWNSSAVDLKDNVAYLIYSSGADQYWAVEFVPR